MIDGLILKRQIEPLDIYSREEIIHLIESYIGPSVPDTETKLLSGTIVHDSGLTYESTDILYKILGFPYRAPARSLTLDAADPSLSRIDLFYVDIFGDLKIATGTPAADPTSPILEPNQLQVMMVLITAGATEPSNVGDVDKVYDENVEWATSSTDDTNTSVDFESADGPSNGTKRIKVEIDIPDTEVAVPLHYIGERYQGGKIFYLESGGQKGLISAEYDTGELWWSPSNLSYPTGGTGLAIGTGQANTTLMMAEMMAAAGVVKFCDSLVIDGYSDFYMPSRDELYQMYLRRFEIGNFGNKIYWSSSEISGTTARRISFATGATSTRVKNTVHFVRAIRSFDDTTIPSGIQVETYTVSDISMSFAAPAPVSALGGILSLKLKSSLAWLQNSSLLIETWLSGTKTGSVAISASTNLFGYRTDDPEWQLIALAMYNFAATDLSFDELVIRLSGSWPNLIDLGIDDIRYQFNGMEIPPDVLTTPGTYGADTKTLILKVNSQGRIVTIAAVPIDFSAFIRKDGTVAFTGDQSMGGHKYTDLGAPEDPNDAARLVDCQNAPLAFNPKDVLLATTENITLANEQTIDTIAAVAGNKVLALYQTDKTENGPYIVAAGGAWTRAADDIEIGMFYNVLSGDENAGTAWYLSVEGEIEIGVTELIFLQFFGLNQVTPGDGMEKIGNRLNVKVATGHLVINGENKAALAETAVTPGTYGASATRKVPIITVDAYGRLTYAGEYTLPAAPTDNYVESAALDAAALLTLGRTGSLADLTVQFGTMALKKFWTGTQAAYDALDPWDADTIYHIEEEV